MSNEIQLERNWKTSIKIFLEKIFMPIIGHIYKIIEGFDALVKIIGDKIVIPGFGGYSLYYIGNFFVSGLTKGSFTIRAKSITYSLFSAIFPMLIFGLSLIPFIPIAGFQEELLAMINDLLPDSLSSVFSETINDTIMNPSGTLLSFGIISTLYFASNGILAIISAFNASYYNVDSRNLISKRLISILLVLIICTLILTAMTLMIGGTKFINQLAEHSMTIAGSNFLYVCLHIAKWLIILLLYFFAISFLYYLAPSKKSRYKFISPGAILATIVQMLCTTGFSYYVENFANYNKVYGSIGTIIIVLMLLYFTSISLILGFELNISIMKANEKNHKLLRKAEKN